jgi:hypothetical protein
MVVNSLSAARSLIAAYSVGLPSEPRSYTHTSTSTIASYNNAFVGTLARGLFYIGRYRNISKTPDLLASITVNLSRLISSTKNLQARIVGRLPPELNLAAYIESAFVLDISARVNAIFAESIYSSISATINCKSLYLDISAFCGGHLPADLSARILSISPLDMSAFIHGFIAGSPVDISSSITASGGYKDLGVTFIGTYRSYASLSASIRVKEPVNLLARISGWAYSDLGATISHSFAAPDLRALIKGLGSAHKNFAGIIRPTQAGSLLMSVWLRGLVRTHTSKKTTSNINVFPRRFFQNRYLVGTNARGFSIVVIEPIFGSFPDLSATIQAVQYYRSNLRACIRGLLFYPDQSNMPTSITGVGPKIFIDRVALNFVLFRSLGASIVGTGGFMDMKTSIKAYVSTNTGTSLDATWSYSRNTTRQFFATSKGLFVLPRITEELKRLSYRNSHNTPDLHAYLYGWATLDMSASIKAWSHTHLSASIVVYDLTHLGHIAAFIRPMNTGDISATISSSGAFSQLSAYITATSSISHLGAKILPYIDPNNRSIICVHTKPFINLGASINFDSTYSCSRQGAYSELLTSIYVKSAESSDLFATITSLRSYKDMVATITGVKRVRTKILTLYYRSRSRDSFAMGATINGYKAENTSDLLCSIVGMKHEADLSASLTVVRLKPRYVYTEEDILLVDYTDPTRNMTARVFFESGPETYIYSSTDGLLYSSDNSVWKVIVREKAPTTSTQFFDGETLRSKMVHNITNYDSFDEAVRAAIDALVSPNTFDIGASISASGAVASLYGSIVATAVDKLSDIGARIYEVPELPDISATITPIGYMGSLLASIRSMVDSSSSLAGSLHGYVESDVLASLTAVA